MLDHAATINTLLTRAAALDSQGHHWSGEPAREFFAAADALRDAVEQLRLAQQFQFQFEAARTIDYDNVADETWERNGHVVYEIEGLEDLHSMLTSEQAPVPTRDIDDPAITNLFILQTGVQQLIDIVTADAAIYEPTDKTTARYAALIAEKLSQVLHHGKANNDELREDIAKVLAYRDKLAWSQVDEDRKNLYLETATGILGLASRAA